jgi:hypothetical protein
VILSKADIRLIMDRSSAKCNRFTERLRAMLITDYSAADLDDFDNEEVAHDHAN